MNWFVYDLTQLQTKAVSVERIAEYTEKESEVTDQAICPVLDIILHDSSHTL